MCRYETPQVHGLDDALDDALIMCVDVKDVVMRLGGLWAISQKTTGKTAHQLKTCWSRGEKRKRKRLALVGTACNAAWHICSAEVVMGFAKVLQEETLQIPSNTSGRVSNATQGR